MTTIHHFAYTVEKLDDDECKEFFSDLLGMKLVRVSEGNPNLEAFERKHRQRWYEFGPRWGRVQIHVVENPEEVTTFGWGHLCLCLSGSRFDAARESRFVERDNSDVTGRFWLAGPGGFRVEVRRYVG